MSAHTDILDEAESLRNPLVGSLLFHVLVFGGFGLLGYEWEHSHETWGSPNAGGGAVAINSVKTIPLPARAGRVNPVANPTESQVPIPKEDKVTKERTPAEDPNAIPLKSREKPKKETPEARSSQKYRPTYEPNQLTSNVGQAAVSPMFSKQGVGGVGIDQNSVLGSRFGAYAALLMQRVAERWQTGGLQGLQAPFVVVSVDILRNGSIRNPHVTQASGNYQLDTSSLRAVTEAAPFPPLPPEYERDVVSVDFKFQLQR
jgi:protein TonB